MASEWDFPSVMRILAFWTEVLAYYLDLIPFLVSRELRTFCMNWREWG
jgi:hypothetical protein